LIINKVSGKSDS